MDALNMKTIVLLISLIVLLPFCVSKRSKTVRYQDAKIETFQDFKEVFDKRYINADHESDARKHFEASKKWLNENRNRYSHKVGFTSMSDVNVTHVHHTGHLPDTSVKESPFVVTGYDRNMSGSLTRRQAEIPSFYDLRQNMAPITDQGNCGSCWAHAASAVAEFYISRHVQRPVVISTEEVIDCSIRIRSNNFQCNGGNEVDVFDYIKQKGIHSLQNYPMRPNSYHCHSWNSDRCEPLECLADGAPGNKYHIDKYYSPGESTDEHIAQTILKYGPASVSIQVPHDSTRHVFSFYSGDIIQNYNRNPGPSTHSVVIVGWGHDEKEDVDYWIVRNSWGTNWGEYGYFKLQRGINSMGINRYPVWLY